MTPEQMAATIHELDVDSSDEEQKNVAPSFTTGETKQENTATKLHSNTNTHLTYLVQPRLHGKRQRLPSLNVLWIRIFSYSGPTEKETVSFRCLCKLFSKALKPPCWTSFPHPNYSSLGALFGRFDVLSRSNSINIPKMVLIENGIHEIEIYQNQYGKDCNFVNINLPISIIGESREHCVVMGGLLVQGDEEEDINVSNLTLRGSKVDGVCSGYNGASIHLDNVSVENSGCRGVYVYSTKRNYTMKNCNVSHSKSSGLEVYGGGLMTIDGNATTIHHNGTGGDGYYGLNVGFSSSIHLVSPLTKEMISTNNNGGQNYSGTIQTITNNNTKEKNLSEDH